jgi:hypothetical protein
MYIKKPIYEKTMGLSLIFISLISMAMVLYRALLENSNHVGITSYVLILASMPSLLYGLLIEKCISLKVIFGILNILVLVFVVESNLLINYETWTERHMPEKPFGLR